MVAGEIEGPAGFVLSGFGYLLRKKNESVISRPQLLTDCRPLIIRAKTKETYFLLRGKTREKYDLSQLEMMMISRKSR